MSRLRDKLFGVPSGVSALGGRFRTAHHAASLDDARLSSWLPAAGSADADMLPELGILTPRARDLARNSGLAGGYIQTAKDNIIGHQLRLNAIPDYLLLGRDKDWARTWSKQVEAEFRTWADTTECDAAHTQTLWGLARVALAAALMNGDHVTLPKWLPQNGARWATRLQNIESDRLSTPPREAANPQLRGGVEIDGNGAPVAYWIQQQHPGDRYGLTGSWEPPEWVRVPAFTAWGRRRVIHLHDKERPGQTRGAPVFTRVLREFRVSSEYVGNELHASAANALIAAFLETDMSQEAVSGLFGDSGAEMMAQYQDPQSYLSQIYSRFNRKKLDSGLIMPLPPGTRLSSFDTARPNVNFGEFMGHVSRYIAAGLNVPYELLMKDFTQSNYSSARAALLEAWRYFLSYRRTFTELFLAPIYALWFEEAVNRGSIDAPDYYDNPYAYLRARWTFAGRGWVDPVKEAVAAQTRIESGLSTLEAECAEQGHDWEELADQQAVEREYRAALNLPDPYATAGRGFAPTNDQQVAA